MKTILRISLVCIVLVALGLVLYYPVRRVAVRHQIETDVQNTHFARMDDLGSTRKLVILPLYENAASQADLTAGHGVAYLVSTDDATILFDLGFDTDALQHNMQKLGLSLDDIDMIVISHDYPDHVGGQAWWPQGTFSLADTQVDLHDLPIYVPQPMTYPGLAPVVADHPIKLATGVASMGTIPGEEVYKASIGHFIRLEQSLAVNVQGVGIVLISGCGHPGVKNMLGRAEMLFTTPVAGVVGGLHYQDLKRDALQGDIQMMKDRHLQLLAISPHDSMPATIQIFKDEFPNIYQDIAVGRAITIGNHQ